MTTLANLLSGSKQVVLVLGTGISTALSEGEPTSSWRGLIENGHDWLHNYFGDSYLDTKKAIDCLLDINNLTVAASMVKNGFKEIGDQAYANWLESAIGRMEVKNESLGKAIAQLRCTILTTNYDTLVEKATGLASTTWLAPSEVRDSITGKVNLVVHLHGIWNKNESVIFSEEDYGALMASTSAQQIQQSVSSVTTLVYIGFGAGLSDPNFSRLIKWTTDTFSGSITKHYRLCIESEKDELDKLHANDQISTMVYGQSFDELEEYLRDAAKAGEHRDFSEVGIAIDRPKELQNLFHEQLRNESLVLEESTSDLYGIQDFIMEPVLLPVAHREYIQTRGEDNNNLERLAFSEEIKNGESTLLVSESGYGLTTAVKYFGLELAREWEVAIPVYISFNELSSRKTNPLLEALKNRFTERGYTCSDPDTFPDHVLIIDDIDPHSRGVARVLSDISRNSSAASTVLGCKQGVEEQLNSLLRSNGLRFKVRYVGKLETDDINHLVETIVPTHAKTTARQIIEVMEKGRIPRTPFNVKLIAYVLLQGRKVEIGNESSILRQFLDLLLDSSSTFGNNNNMLDGRGQSVLLSHLAEEMLRAGKIAREQSDVVELFAQKMKDYGWKVEHATTLVNKLCERRILTKDGNLIRFSRSSYLFIYAAQRADTNEDFESFLLENPLRNSQILIAATAFRRNNLALLDGVCKILPFDPYHEGINSPFSKVRPAIASAINERNESYDDSQDIEPYEPSAQFLFSDDSDIADFSQVDHSSLPPLRRLLIGLNLVSRVLRDTDEISDLEKKTDYLLQVLPGWGNLVNMMMNDEDIRNFALYVFRPLVSDIDDKTKRENTLEHIVSVLPGAVAMSAVASELSSPKLLVPFEKALAQLDTNNREAVLGALFFIWTIKHSGWFETFEKLIRTLDLESQISGSFFVPLLEDYYIHEGGSIKPETGKGIARLCADIRVKSMGYDSTIKSSARSHFIQNLEKRKLDFSRRARR
ncbi:SIR2 family protein [Arcanobacterium phocae]|uniref:SIR2 family protein n=1 Tax=Arcanobacterium phocae TaxID=131112 RepID=UPI001C0EE03E|nr:SIR2 family protein [Arcanobacterium phocae]